MNFVSFCSHMDYLALICSLEIDVAPNHEFTNLSSCCWHQGRLGVWENESMEINLCFQNAYICTHAPVSAHLLTCICAHSQNTHIHISRVSHALPISGLLYFFRALIISFFFYWLICFSTIDVKKKKMTKNE